jgi:hypothetical protein
MCRDSQVPDNDLGGLESALYQPKSEDEEGGRGGVFGCRIIIHRIFLLHRRWTAIGVYYFITW